MGEDVGVEIRLSPEAQLVRADPGQLEQVLINLALNARDAMPRGGRISVETFQAELAAEYAQAKQGTSVQPGRYAVLAISDTGHGMDKQTLSHVFEPFFTTKGLGKGTGLGLSTVYGIVKQSDGYVWVYSEPGQGTTLKIYLPLRTGNLSAASSDSVSVPATAGETILVVEDDELVGQMMKRALELAGYRVLHAGGPSEALALVKQTAEKINLLLIDLVMPEMSGRDLAEEIERVIPGVAALFTSGYTDGEIQRRGLLAPGAAFIQKPLTPQSLVRAVQRTLRTASPQAAALGDAAS
jgi:CheY-like chemotaxis protein